MNTTYIRAALTAADHAPFTPARISGCGRAYVCVTSENKKVIKAVETACKQIGLRFNRKGFYGVGPNSIYLGYDNADGRALGKSDAFAKMLNDHGIPCYADAVAD